jgi:hypothetical protein
VAVDSIRDKTGIELEVMPIEPESDQDGNITSNNITEWSVSRVRSTEKIAAGTPVEFGVLLKFRYVDGEAPIGTNEEVIRLVVMPQECLAFAEELKRVATQILDSLPQSEYRPN